MRGLPSNTKPFLWHGNSLDLLREIPDESVDAIVTSPPYLAKRQYPVQGTFWPPPYTSVVPPHEGEHAWVESWPLRKRGASDKGGSSRLKGSANGENYDVRPSRLCASCSAWVGALGEEPTVELYIAHLTQVFTEGLRVLKSEGSLWLNLGTTRATHAAGLEGAARWKKSGLGGLLGKTGRQRLGDEMSGQFDKRFTGYKEKDLIDVPGLAAEALRKAGYYYRSEIVWCKVTKKPERVDDRPTDSTEKILFLTKGTDTYWNVEEAHKIRRQDCLGATGNLGNYWMVSVERDHTGHVAPYPLEIPLRCIRLGCPKGGLVLDPFAGSGTTLMAAEKWGARSIGIELSVEYLARGVERNHLNIRNLQAYDEATVGSS